MCRLVVLLVQCRIMVFSCLLLVVIVHSGASSNDVTAPNGHSIRGIATSSAFFKELVFS